MIIEQTVKIALAPDVEIRQDRMSDDIHRVGERQMCIIRMRTAQTFLLKLGAFNRSEPRSINIADMLVLPNCVQILDMHLVPSTGDYEIRFLQELL